MQQRAGKEAADEEEVEELKRHGFGSCLLDRGAAEEARGRRRRQENVTRTSKAFFLGVCSITTSRPAPPPQSPQTAVQTTEQREEEASPLLIE